MTRFSWPTLDVSRKLSPEEATELAARVAELTRAGLPLGAGLRALAEEVTGRRLAHVLLALADRLDAGDDLGAALDALGQRLPPQLRGVVLAGLRSGQLPEVLEEYVDIEQNQADLRRRLWTSLLYPFVLLVVLTAMIIIARVYIIDPFVSIYRDFKTDLPKLTTWFIASSWSMCWGMLGLVVLAAFVPLLLASARHVKWLWPAVYKIPMIGPMMRWGHLAQFGRMMNLLLGQRVPLPDALQLASAGLPDGNLAAACCNVADEVSNGRVLYQSLANRRQFPASMVAVIEWGQRAPALPDAFQAVAEMFEGRARSQSPLLEAIVLPVTLLVIIAFVGTFVAAMMLPLIRLIDALSSGC